MISELDKAYQFTKDLITELEHLRKENMALHATIEHIQLVPPVDELIRNQRVTQLEDTLRVAKAALENNLAILDAYGGPTRNALARAAIDTIKEVL